MKATVNASSLSLSDPALAPSALTDITFKHGVASVQRILASVNYTSDASNGSGSVIKQVWTTPSQKYVILHTFVEIVTDLASSGNPGAITSLAVKLSTSVPYLSSAGGSFVSNVYDATSANKIWWDSVNDPGTPVLSTGLSSGYWDSGLVVGYGVGTLSQPLNLVITTATSSWTLVSGTVNVHLLVIPLV